MAKTNGNSAGLKTLVTLGAIGTIIASVMAYMKPIQQSIKDQDQEIAFLRTALHETSVELENMLNGHINSDNEMWLSSGKLHTASASDRAAMREQFKEIETQFAWMSDVVNRVSIKRYQLIQMLWKKVYEQELPDDDYHPIIGKDK